MIELVRPMLAAPTKAKDLQALRFPLLASTKIDGLRALCRRNPETGKPEIVSRTLKLIPNDYVQHMFAVEELVGLDGELVVGLPTDKNLMQQTTSGCMSKEGCPDVRWYVFDKWDEDTPYVHRAVSAKEAVYSTDAPNDVVWVSHHPVYNLKELEELEDKWVKEGYEGMMLRSPNGPYKQNRSTLKEGYLLKVKRFADDEAEVLGFEEQQRNDNEATTDERGYTKRSTHAAGKVAAGILGALLVRDCKTGIEFSIGTGFTLEQRKNLWEGRKYLVGKIVTYKHFAIGVVDKPRFPTFKAFRDKRDM